MFRGNIGTRTGRNVLEGKEIHCDSAGFDNFEDYFTDSDSSLPEKTVVDTVVQPTVKSFINPEPSIRDGDSPLSKIPSKKRLSFRTEAASDSDSSSIASFQQRSRLISKRGMRSFPGEDEGDEEKWSSEPFSPFSAPIKTYTPGSKGSVSSHTHSEKKRVQRISNRGMKSFPDDEEEEEEDDLCVYEILDDSPVQLPPEPIVMKKIVALEQRLILSALGKENEENLCRIQNNENTQQLSPKSTSRVSPSIVKVNPNVGKKTTKSMPVQNWYIWDDDSLLDGAKMIITPYGVHADTGVKNKFPDLGSNLHVIDEDEPQQSSRKNWKSKMPHLVRLSSDESASEKGQTHPERTKSSKEKQTKTLPRKKSPVKPTVKKVLPQSHVSNGKPSKDLSDEEETSVIESSEVEVLVTDGVNSVNKNSEERSESAETEESSTLVAESTDEEWKASKSKKKVRKPEVSPLRKRISLRHKTPSTGKKTSSAKRTLGSRKTKSLPAKEKRKSREPSPRNRKALTGGKKSQSLDRKKEEVKKTVSSLTKGKVSLTKKNEPVNTRNGKRAPSLSPEMKSSAKRGKLNYKSPSSPSNGKGSPSKKNEPVHTKSGKRASSSSPKSKIPTKLRKLNNRSPPSPSYMTRSSASNKSMSPVKTQKKMGSRKNEEVKSNSENCLSVSPSHIIMPPPRSNPSESTQDMPASCTPVKSEAEKKVISLGFNSAQSNLSDKDADLSDQSSNRNNYTANSSCRIDILEGFNSKEFHPKLDKPNEEENKDISLYSQSNEEGDVPASCTSIKSETGKSEAISLGFNSAQSNLSDKDADLSDQSSNRNNYTTNSSCRINILEVFDTKELHPKLDKPNEEENKDISSYSRSDEEGDVPASCTSIKSETGKSEVISLGFNSAQSNLSDKDADLSGQSSNRNNSTTNFSCRINILEGFNSKESNPKLDKPNEKLNKDISSHSPSDEEGEHLQQTDLEVPELKNTPDETCGVEHANGSKTAPQKTESKKPSIPTLPVLRKRRSSGQLASDDSIMAFSKDKRKSGPLPKEDSLVAFSQGLSKRISAGKSKSPAKTNPVQKDLNLSNFESHEGPPDWQCKGCNGLLPQCLMTCIFCCFRRQESSQEDTNESDNTSSEEVTDWKCEGCEALIPVSLEACIFCGLCKQNVSQDAEIQMSQHGSSPSTYYRNILSNMRGKNKKTSPQKLKDKQPKSPKGKTSKLESPVLQNTSPKTMTKQKSSFIMKTSYKFNSYENLKMDHRVSYCVCSQSDTAIIGMMKLQRGGYRKSNYSLKEMCFTVLDGQVTVHIDQEKRELSAHDTFIVAVDGEYSIKNNNTRNACLIFTIIK